MHCRCQIEESVTSARLVVFELNLSLSELWSLSILNPHFSLILPQSFLPLWILILTSPHLHNIVFPFQNSPLAKLDHVRLTHSPTSSTPVPPGISRSRFASLHRAPGARPPAYIPQISPAPSQSGNPAAVAQLSVSGISPFRSGILDADIVAIKPAHWQSCGYCQNKQGWPGLYNVRVTLG